MKMLRVAIVSLLLAVFLGAQICHAAPVSVDGSFGMNGIKDCLKQTIEKFGMTHSQTPYMAMSDLNKKTTEGIMDKAKKEMKAAKDKKPSKMVMPETKVGNMPSPGKVSPVPKVKVGDTKATMPDKTSNLMIKFPL